MDRVRIVSGPLAAWQEKNANATIPHCIKMLETSGVIDNFRRIVGESGAEYKGFVFADSDLYKVIEAVAWEIARSGTSEFDLWLDQVIDLVSRVQELSGYVMTWIQGEHPEKKFAELDWTHEMYVLGHLIQAGVALDRATGRTDLLGIAVRFADLVDRRFGPGREEGICGHPEIEMALVELYRHTGAPKYLELASRMVDLRGKGLLGAGAMGAKYFQDHLPVRQAKDAVGHAVRQLYLCSGVTDVYIESGDQSLLEAMHAQWESVHLRKMYLTGAFGSRHRDEAFGENYELPSDRAYAETCATIADIQWNWRMLLATGIDGPDYSSIIERELYNALAAAVDEEGTKFFYSNPLQLRADRIGEENAPRERQPWYSCACCPPSIARTIAQFSSYMATHTNDGLFVHQIASMDIDVPSHLGEGVIEIRTDFPESGEVEVTLKGNLRANAQFWIRVPQWASWEAEEPTQVAAYTKLSLVPGVPSTLAFGVSPRMVRPNPSIDSVRGSVAFEVGPRVFCIEDIDLTEGTLDQIRVLSDVPPRLEQGTLRLTWVLEDTQSSLYVDASTQQVGTSREVELRAIPFALWGNRGGRAMRVWIPEALR